MAEQHNDVDYGLLAAAGIELAVPISALREVVPCPPELASLPVSATGLLGAMNLRSQILPVVDLGPLIGRPSTRHSDQMVTVVAHAGRVVGILTDEVRGVTSVATSALRAIAADGGGLLFSDTFAHPVDGNVVSVLDVASVLHRPGIPTVADAVRADGADDERRMRSQASGRKVTVVRCGPHKLALDVARVHTTLLSPLVRPSVLTSSLCRGVTSFSDREVPVVDPLVLLGVGELSDDDATAGLVLDLGPGYVVLALSALLDLTELADDDVLALSAFAAPRPELLRGMADLAAEGACLVLDESALFSHPELVSLASVNTSLEGGEQSSAATGSAATKAVAGVGGGTAYLTYEAGVVLTSALGQVTEILPFPTATTKLETANGVLGVVVHRRAAVPVVCLATVLGRSPEPVSASSCLLLVEVEGDQVAFAVSALHTIDPLAWTDPDAPTASPGTDPAGWLFSSPLVQVGVADRLIPDLDLVALAASISRSVRRPPRLASRGEPVDDEPAVDGTGVGEAIDEDVLGQDEVGAWS